MDVGTISIVLVLGLVFLLGIGMPLGFASAFLAACILVLHFGPGPIIQQFGSGPLSVLGEQIYGLLTDTVLLSIPFFILMAALLEHKPHASRTRDGVQSKAQLSMTRTPGPKEYPSSVAKRRLCWAPVSMSIFLARCTTKRMRLSWRSG